MIEFSREPLQVLEDNFHLAQEHWDEVMRTSHPLDMHWDLYRFIERAGNLVCFYAHEGQEVAGYALFMLQPQLHSKRVSSASNDAVFIRKISRKGWNGIKFIKYCDQQLRQIGIRQIVWQVTPQVDYSRVLQSLGYKKFSTLYTKDIGG